MKLLFERSKLHSQINYGELLTSSVKSYVLQDQHVIVLTNQRYYDRFFQKIEQSFPENKIDCYICRNQLYCNNLDELKEVLIFLSQFPPSAKYLLLAFGNEGVVELTGFLQKNILLDADYWVVAPSFSAMFTALSENKIIWQNPYHPVMLQKNLPSQLFLDQTIVQKQNEGKLVDLQSFIQIAVLTDGSLLRELYQVFPTKKNLTTASLTAFISPAVKSYEKNAVPIADFGKLFEKAFYLTENGHLLSAYMKRFLAFLFQLFWNVVTFDLDFPLSAFMQWLKDLGYPLNLPSQFLIGDYLEQLASLQKEVSLSTLTKIGHLGKNHLADEKSLLRAMDYYQRIISEI
ncbi:MAG TPA: hypothetical protein VK118_02525 [Tetragenococcus sp.]|nr:hypothetical protein [Tetragenococcus sp.]